MSDRSVPNTPTQTPTVLLSLPTGSNIRVTPDKKRVSLFDVMQQELKIKQPRKAWFDL